MGAIATRSFFCTIGRACLSYYQGLQSFPLDVSSRRSLLLPLLIVVLLLIGCKTVPIQNRNFSERGGFWEQDENTSSRFHHNLGNDKAVIGSLYSSGKSVLLEGAQVGMTSKVNNNSYVSTGSQSSARIEFKASDSTCSVRVDEMVFGNAYADTTDCQQIIETLHARIEAKNAILHIHVSQQQTEVTVISGVITVMLREQASQSIDIRADREIIITHDAIGRSYPVTPDEIWQRIRWREDFPLYKKVVDWETIIAVVVVGAVAAGVIAAVILLGKGDGSGRGSGGFPRHH